LSKPDPPAKPSPPAPRDLRFQQMGERSSRPPSFQFLWPELKSAGGAKFAPYLKEIEAKVLKQSKEKILALEKEAYEKGFAQGEKDGIELGHKKTEVVLQQLRSLLAEMERQRNVLYHNFGREMVHLILGIAQKVLHREIVMKEDDITQTLQRAITQVVDRKKVIVHLHPADYQALADHPDSVPYAQGAEQGLKIVADPGIQRGGCLLETSFGDVDATIDAQLGCVAEQIWKIFEETGPPLPPPS
jgi:flagellar assembly protein FliH